MIESPVQPAVAAVAPAPRRTYAAPSFGAQLWTVFQFELSYRLRRPATYIYLAICLGLGLLIGLTDVVRLVGGFGKVNANAPFIIGTWVGVIGTILGFFLFSAIMSVPVYRDYEHSVFSFLFSYPIRKEPYLSGRFLGSLLIAWVVVLGFPLGLMMAEQYQQLTADAAKAANYGPFSAWAYVQPMLTMILPNLIFLGAVYFVLPTLTRKIFFTYVLGISVIVLYSIAGQLLQVLVDSGNRDLATLLDPFGFRAFGFVTEYWSVAEKNSRLVPLDGWFLYNRLLWGGIGVLVFLFCLWRFRFNVGGVGGARRLPTENPVDLEPALRLPRPKLNFNLGTAWGQFTSTFKVELQSTVRNVFFLVFLIAIGLYVVMDAVFADEIYGTGVHPVTSVMIRIEGSTFGLLLLILLTFLSGEVIWRERQLRLDQVYDALPLPKASTFFAKLFSLWVVPVAFLAMLIVIGVLVQLAKGFTSIELGLYLQHMFVMRLPVYILTASLAFIAQVIVNNKFAGHGVMVLYFLSGLALNRLGLEHPLWDFGSGTGVGYSDMDGYGNLRPFQWYLLHWSLVTVVLLAVAYGFYVHGTEGGIKARVREFGRRFRTTRGFQLATAFSLLACVGTGYWIWHNTTQVDDYQTEKQREKYQVRYEQLYKWLQRAPQPKVTSVNLAADMYPDDYRLQVKGSIWLRNKTSVAIDTVWTFWPVDKTRYTATWNRTASAVDKDTTGDGQWIAYVLEQPLAPGDSISLAYTASFARPGFANNSNVRGNGTFFNSSNVMPGFGYNAGLELQDDDKRREYGLKERPPLPAPSDSVAVNTGLFEQDADWIDFECTLSTAEDQTAIAPGYLQRKWTENGRAYFHYKMDQPILKFFNVTSARYAVKRDTHNGVNIEIYHIPQHAFNVDKMIASVKASLDYYGKNFAPYQHKQVRILEFPSTAGTFAQSFANTIPYSEGIGFIAKLGDEKDVDYVYYVTAHEMAHQWWGHQAAPAAVRGGQFISETLSQYSAMMVLKQEYGLAPMRKYLRYELNRYLTGRSGENRKENTLMEVEFQDYIYYRKGSVVMFALQDYLGEDNFNRALANFLRPVRLQGPPYPTMTAWYDSVKAVTPDSLAGFLEDQMQKITLYENRVLSAEGKVLATEKLKNSKGKDSTVYDSEITLKLLTGKFYADSLGAMADKPLPMDLPVELGLLSAQIPVKASDLLLLEKRRLQSSGSDTLTVVLRYKGKKPSYAGIDPINKLVDRNVEDNLTLVNWADTEAKPAATPPAKPKPTASRQ